MKQYYFIEFMFNKIVAEEYNHNRQRNLYENISSLLFYQKAERMKILFQK